jgi:hypothetical protein
MANKQIARSGATASAPGLGPVDQKIMKLAGLRKSPEEISNEIGGILSATEVAARIIRINQSHDWLSTLDQKRLLLDDMAALVGRLKTKVETAEYLHKDDANAYRTALKDMMTMINEVNTQDEATMMRISEAHAHIMASAIRLGYERAVFELQKRYPIEEAEAYEALEAAIPIAFETLTDG